MCKLGNTPRSDMCQMMQALLKLTVLALLLVGSKCVSPRVKRQSRTIDALSSDRLTLEADR